MKKIMLSIMLGILLLSIVSAGLGLDKANEERNLTDKQKQKFVDKINEKYDTNFSKEQVGTGEIRIQVKEILKERAKAENKTLWLNVSGKNISIKELDEDKLELITQKINAKTGLNLTIEEVANLSGENVGAVLRAFLSNGRWANIRIMPDSASEKATEVLKAKCEERNCTIELKEVSIGKSNETKLAYEVSTEKESRVILLFRKRMLLKAQVDAETGQVIAVKKPWWARLAKEE